MKIFPKDRLCFWCVIANLVVFFANLVITIIIIMSDYVSWFMLLNVLAMIISVICGLKCRSNGLRVDQLKQRPDELDRVIEMFRKETENYGEST